MKTTSFLTAGIAAITFSTALTFAVPTAGMAANDDVSPSLPASWLETMGRLIHRQRCDGRPLRRVVC